MFINTSKNSEISVKISCLTLYVDLLLSRTHLCNYDINLTYPQNGIIPPVPLRLPTARDVPFFLKTRRGRYNLMSELKRRYSRRGHTLSKRDQEQSRRSWKRDLSLRANGTIDPWVCIPVMTSIEHTLTNYSMDAYSLTCSLIMPSTTLSHGVGATSTQPYCPNRLFLGLSKSTD